MKNGIRKGFKAETIAKLLALCEIWVSFFLDQLKKGLPVFVAISKGNHKMGHVWSASLLPVYTCKNCKHCQHFCYAISAALRFLNVMKAYARNTALAMFSYDLYFNQILSRLTNRVKNKYFRWHVSGEILDYEYFCWMVKVAEMRPEWRFWTYTKMYGIVNTWIKNHGGSKSALPKNLSIMFSVWFDENSGEYIPINNPYNMPVFTCRPNTNDPDPAAWHCPGACGICIASGHGCPFSESAFIDLHQ